MNLVPYTFEGVALRDTNYFAAFRRDGGNPMLHPGVDITLVPREHASPKLGYKARKPGRYVLDIKMLGTISTQIDTLKGLFDPYLAEDGDDASLGTLICKDSANGDKQWSLLVTVEGIAEIDGQQLTIILVAPDPIWKAVTPTTTVWNLTASAQTQSIAIGGNQPCKPVIRLKPTADKAAPLGADKYRRLILIRNRADTGGASAFTRYPLDITGGGWNTAALVNDTTISNQLNGAINDSVTTINIDTAVGGGLPGEGLGYVGTEQISWTANSGTQLTGVTRGVGGTSAASHADNAVIAFSHMLANGDDIRLMYNGASANFWFGTGANAMNQAATKIWANIDLKPASATANHRLGTAIAGAGAISTITLLVNPSSGPLGSGQSQSWPEASKVLIGSEVFTYTAKNFTSKQLTGITRAALGTSAAAHSVNDVVHLIDNDIWLIYGNGSAGTRTTDDTYKPVIALTSSNTSHVYADFADTGYLRPGAWKPISSGLASPAASRVTKQYTASQDFATVTDPAAVVGIQMAAWLKGGKWQAESGTIGWSWAGPVPATAITATGHKYRAGTDWPTGRIGLAVNIYADGLASQIWAEATPSAPTSWEALASHSGVAISPGQRQLRMGIGGGSVAKTANNYVAMQFTDVTLTLDSTYVPAITFGAEEALEASGYSLDLTVTNNTSGEWIRVVAQVDLDEEFEIDCENKSLKYLFDDSFIPCQFYKSSVRHDWLNLSPGTVELQIDETGLTGLTATVLTYDRNS